jgi:hypothetical protein
MKKSRGDVVLERVENEFHNCPRNCQGHQNLAKKYVKIKDKERD